MSRDNGQGQCLHVGHDVSKYKLRTEWQGPIVPEEMRVLRTVIVECSAKTSRNAQVCESWVAHTHGKARFERVAELRRMLLLIGDEDVDAKRE